MTTMTWDQYLRHIAKAITAFLSAVAAYLAGVLAGIPIGELGNVTIEVWLLALVAGLGGGAVVWRVPNAPPALYQPDHHHP